MLATRPFTNAELRKLLEDLAARHFAPGDLSIDRGLIAEAARRLAPSGDSGNLQCTAQAIADHFIQFEQGYGRTIKDRFHNPMTKRMETNSVTIPVPMLRALVAAVKGPAA